MEESIDEIMVFLYHAEDEAVKLIETLAEFPDILVKSKTGGPLNLGTD